MINRDVIPILKSCRMDFGKMAESGNARRHCHACDKDVHDLTLLTEGEARRLLSEGAENGICVRYLADAHGDLVLLPPVPTSRLTRKKRAVLASIALAAAVGTTGCAEALGGMPRHFTLPARTRIITAKSYELVRGQVRVSIIDEPSPFEVRGPGLGSAFLQGRCDGPVGDCDELQTILARSSTTTEFLDALQQNGYTLVMVRRGPVAVH